MSMQAEAALDPDAGPAPDPANGVAVAYVYLNDVSFSWHRSVIDMLLFDHEPILRGGYIATHCGTGNLVQARNQTAQTFLDERAAADWLLWLDTDMGFEPNALSLLLAAADPVERPVVGGLCFAQREIGPDGMGGWITQPSPTVFDWASYDDHAGFIARQDYARDAVTQAAGTGSAMILIHRSVLAAMRERYGPCWYSRIPNHSAGEMTSEDLSFCMRLMEMKIPLFIHTGVKTTHHKAVWVDERQYDRLPPAPMAMPPGVTRWPLDGLTAIQGPPPARRPAPDGYPSEGEPVPAEDLPAPPAGPGPGAPAETASVDA
jgi:hypothetical protein